MDHRTDRVGQREAGDGAFADHEAEGAQDEVGVHGGFGAAQSKHACNTKQLSGVLTVLFMGAI